MRPALGRVVEMADATAAHQLARPVPAWHWGPALQGFAYARLQEHLGDDRYTALLLRYARHHVEQGPSIDSSDTAAPGLVTFELERLGHAEFAATTQQVVDYIREAPRAVGNAVNHLGDGMWSRLYPRSVWVDTLMMFGVFPARVGRARHDVTLLDAAATLPLECARLLQHPSGLWTHSYWADAWHSPGGRRYPSRTFWARGNGWVVAALPMILDEIGDHPNHAAIVELLRDTSEALLPIQADDGSWTTVLNGRVRGKPESSATAFIAAGWLHAVRLGWLPERFVAPARRALEFVVGCIVDGAAAGEAGIVERWLQGTAADSPDGAYTGPALTRVSGPTIPLPVLPRLGYTHLTPDAVGASYGFAAAVLAAIADDQLAD